MQVLNNNYCADVEKAILQELVDNPYDLTPWNYLRDMYEDVGDERLAFLTGDTQKSIDLLLKGVKPPVPSFTNSIGMEMVLIPAGTFLMGSPDSEGQRFDNEGPQHLVRISKPFYLGKYPVTQAQWQAVMGSNPSHFRGDNLPVESVSWIDCQEFVRVLSEKYSANYCLPSEAEWEYACRAGTTTAFAWGDSLSSHLTNFDGNHPYGDAPKGKFIRQTTPVGSYLPNAWGIYDMHGNVWEWCQSKYKSLVEGEYSSDPTASCAAGRGAAALRTAVPPSVSGSCRAAVSPTSAAGSAYHHDNQNNYLVCRGGSWYNHGRFCRSAYRHWYVPGYWYR